MDNSNFYGYDLAQQQKQQQQQQQQLQQQQSALGLGLDDDDDEDILDEMDDTMGEYVEQQQQQPLLMKFCPHDSSMLYPKEDKRTRKLRYVCARKGCGYSEETFTTMVYQNILKQEVGNVLYKVPSAVADDPTLPRTQNESCANCGHNEAVFFQSDTSDAQADSLALIFVCCGCGHKWVK
eukprot:CAMPEP_0178970076 /NCGR_PEP_ID=MMETSP0789-20121207/19285_1 /TAXON_ID=3005 /ORGANISM="Rhizosolenia setigera, Strain CCMP 1694" /LENGTH=179 /DNA_ID=CAMNT_0020656429 /DNA_START=29 /DNA_END=568 /DNA_ORIENTATION=+